jgi:xanthine dehydrogenase YagT iron-sulfur-binding subunit
VTDHGARAPEGDQDGNGVGERGRFLLRFIVNGVSREVAIAPHRRLLGVLREELGLTGAKAGCEVGVCGACTVLVDDRPTSSCVLFAAQAADSQVLTVEGLAEHPVMHALQESFIDEGGFQCGFCTSGQLMMAAAVVMSGRIDEMSDADVREHMLGNLCRCGTYYGIARAIRTTRGAGAE